MSGRSANGWCSHTAAVPAWSAPGSRCRSRRWSATLWCAVWSARSSDWHCGWRRVVICTVGAIPLLNAVFPELGAVTVLGMRLNWLVLAVLVYPLLYGVGRLYVRLAEQAERDFVGVVDSEP